MFEKLENEQFVVFDIETTGLDWRVGNQVIELAGQKIINGEVVDQFHELINPTCPVEDGAYRVHGLSNMFLADQGGKAEEHFPRFLEFVEGAVLVGHNILTFDVPFLNADLQRYQLRPLHNMVIDTLVMSRKLLQHLPNHKLGTVATHFGVDPAGAHRAMVDVEMNKQVFLKMLNQYLEQLAQESSAQDIISSRPPTLL